MPRGRPVGSQIRQNIITLLLVAGKPLYGYKIHKAYIRIFPPCTREVVYYHLAQGVKLGVISLAEIRQEQGNFSWGGVVEKRYYGLGPYAHPAGVETDLKNKIIQVLEEIQ